MLARNLDTEAEHLDQLHQEDHRHSLGEEARRKLQIRPESLHQKTEEVTEEAAEHHEGPQKEGIGANFLQPLLQASHRGRGDSPGALLLS